MPGEEHDDVALIARIAQRDRKAFDQLVTRHAARMRRIAMLESPTAADAEDALQHAFLAVWRSAASFSSTGSVRAWLHAVTRNAARRNRRKHSSEPARVESLEELGALAGWGEESAGPEKATGDRESVGRALRTLAEDERDVLLLRDVEGLSGEEVAAELGLTLTAMKGRLHRARLRFVAALEKEEAS